ncbi:MAG: nicotinamide mononucleotide deamidase-related protein [Candidatus Verstraetearchaeota archaeon]|nr:nicotinamide mononucleotide deamidase-related protein [Candidatus Verstraetearchaeota archaeon]
MLVAEILSIGNELLIGKTVNTNASWLGRRLTSMGFHVKRIVVVGDEVEEIAQAVSEALARGARVLITTGGLGPTFDDKTLEGVAAALQKPLVLHEEALRSIKEKYDAMGLPLTPARKKMAKLPEGAIPLPNSVGTAPGAMIELPNTLIFCLPGVPKEMQAMFDGSVASKLTSLNPSYKFYEHTVLIEGIPESSLAPLIDKTMKSYPRVYIKSHPKGSEGRPIIEVHLSTFSTSEEEASTNLQGAADMLIQLAEEYGAKRFKG